MRRKEEEEQEVGGGGGGGEEEEEGGGGGGREEGGGGKEKEEEEDFNDFYRANVLQTWHIQPRPMIQPIISKGNKEFRNSGVDRLFEALGE